MGRRILGATAKIRESAEGVEAELKLNVGLARRVEEKAREGAVAGVRKETKHWDICNSRAVVEGAA